MLKFNEIFQPEGARREAVEGEDEKERELLENIKNEQQEAKEKFADLIALVSARYESLPEKTREPYVNHNEEILNNVVELGMRSGLAKEKLQNLELAAILHDAAKADAVPEEYADVPHYTLARHAKVAAEAVPHILTDDYLKSKNIEHDFELVRKEVAKAIMEHMGPRPGFMDRILADFNAKMKEKGEIGFEYPSAEGVVSEALLAGDMASLVGPGGWRKILADRLVINKFYQEDTALSNEYAQYGIDLSPDEAAILSVYASSLDALQMFSDEKIYEWVEKQLEQSKKMEFSCGEGQSGVSWETANEKRKQYEARRAERAKLNTK